MEHPCWAVSQQLVSWSPELAPQNPQVVFLPPCWFATCERANRNSSLGGTQPALPHLLVPGKPVGRCSLRGRPLTWYSLCLPLIQQRVTEHLLLPGTVPGAHKEATSELAEWTWELSNKLLGWFHGNKHNHHTESRRAQDTALSNWTHLASCIKGSQWLQGLSSPSYLNCPLTSAFCSLVSTARIWGRRQTLGSSFVTNQRSWGSHLCNGPNTTVPQRRQRTMGSIKWHTVWQDTLKRQTAVPPWGAVFSVHGSYRRLFQWPEVQHSQQAHHPQLARYSLWPPCD